MMEGYEKAVKEKLKDNGWQFLRPAKGSHEYWGKEGYESVSVPHKCKSRHTANGIMDKTGIKHKF